MPAPSLEGKGAVVGGGPWEGAGQQTPQWCPGDTTGVRGPAAADDGCGPQSWDPSPASAVHPPRAQGEALDSHSPGTSWERSLVPRPPREALWEGLCPHGQGSLLRPQPPIWAACHSQRVAARPLPPVRWQCQGSKTPGPDSGQEPGPSYCPLPTVLWPWVPAVLFTPDPGPICSSLRVRDLMLAGEGHRRSGLPTTAIPRGCQAGQADSHQPSDTQMVRVSCPDGNQAPRCPGSIEGRL